MFTFSFGGHDAHVCHYNCFFSQDQKRHELLQHAEIIYVNKQRKKWSVTIQQKNHKFLIIFCTYEICLWSLGISDYVVLIIAQLPLAYFLFRSLHRLVVSVRIHKWSTWKSEYFAIDQHSHGRLIAWQERCELWSFTILKLPRPLDILRMHRK